jgi:hypothetical protein
VPYAEPITCVHCPLARFPEPSEQCYKTGGLICGVDDANVGKYYICRFGWDAARADAEREKLDRL